MKRTYHTNTAFLDLLFNTLLCFAALFALSFVLINPSKNEKVLESNAEFIITITWPKDLDNDVDVYVEDPEGHLVAFMRREDGLMHLDRDDLGLKNDIIYTDFGPIEYAENREIVTLRGIVPGEYVVNVHMYTKRATEDTTPVIIQLDKINPFKTIRVKTVILRQQTDEQTAFRFIINKAGQVVTMSDVPKSLIRSDGPSL